MSIFLHCQAAIAQLGERQIEDLKVPGSIPGAASLGFVKYFASFKAIYFMKEKF